MKIPTYKFFKDSGDWNTDWQTQIVGFLADLDEVILITE